MSRIIFGVDTGLDGAIAVMDGDSGQLLEVESCPTYFVNNSTRDYSKIEMLGLVRSLWEPRQGRDVTARAFIEAAPYGMAGPTNIKALAGLHRCQALWEMAFTSFDIGAVTVAPITWRSAMKFPKGAAKDYSIGRALSLWPLAGEVFRSGLGYGTAKAADGKAEAALIAEYGRLHG